MSDPPRLLRSSRNDRVRQALLAGREERPSRSALQRTLLAVGGGPAGVAAGSSALSEAAGTAAGAPTGVATSATNAPAAQLSSGVVSKAASAAGAVGKASAAATGVASIAAKCIGAGVVLWGATQLPSAWQAIGKHPGAPPPAVTSDETAERPTQAAALPAVETGASLAPLERGKLEPRDERRPVKRRVAEPREAERKRVESTDSHRLAERSFAGRDRRLAGDVALAPEPRRASRLEKPDPIVPKASYPSAPSREREEASPPRSPLPAAGAFAESGSLPTNPVDSKAVASKLAKELDQIARADTALRSGHPRQSLALLESYEQRFAPAQLRMEAWVLRMEAWQRLGESARARAVASRILHSNTATAHARRAREILDQTEEKK